MIQNHFSVGSNPTLGIMKQTIYDFFVNLYTQTAAWYRRTTYKLFTPSNKLLLRNVGNGWIDRDERMFHAMFTILCEFVEKELDGPEKLRKILRKMRKTIKNNANDAGFANQYHAMRTFYRLYRWYNTVNWDNPVVESPEYSKLISETTFSTVELNHGVHQLKIDNPKPAEYASERQIHALKIEKFEQLRQQRMHQLVRVYRSMWT